MDIRPPHVGQRLLPVPRQARAPLPKLQVPPHRCFRRALECLDVATTGSHSLLGIAGRRLRQDSAHGGLSARGIARAGGRGPRAVGRARAGHRRGEAGRYWPASSRGHAVRVHLPAAALLGPEGRARRRHPPVEATPSAGAFRSSSGHRHPALDGSVAAHPPDGHGRLSRRGGHAAARSRRDDGRRGHAGGAGRGPAPHLGGRQSERPRIRGLGDVHAARARVERRLRRRSHVGHRARCTPSPRRSRPSGARRVLRPSSVYASRSARAESLPPPSGWTPCAVCRGLPRKCERASGASTARVAAQSYSWETPPPAASPSCGSPDANSEYLCDLTVPASVDVGRFLTKLPGPLAEALQTPAGLVRDFLDRLTV